MLKPILVLTSLFLLTTQISFEITLDHYERWCFWQFVSESTPYHFKVTGRQSGEYEFSHVFKNGKILYKNTNTKDYVKRFDSYAAVSGQYQFCIQNTGLEQDFIFLFLEGIDLADVKNIPTEKESKQIDQAIQVVNKVFQQVKQRQHYSMTINEYNMELQKLVSFKSVGFGFLSITVVLIISFLHYLQIKRVLHNRKII